MNEIRIAIVDDHPIARDGLCQFLDACPDMTVVGTASTADSGLALIRDTQPEVAIIDLHLPCADQKLFTPGVYGYGVSLVFECLQQFPTMIVLALTGLPSAVYKEAVLQTGAHGFLSKAYSGPEIADAIRRTYKGERLHECEGSTPVESLTQRELEILHLISQGLTEQQIAYRLHISLNTVATHRKNVYSKLNISNRVEAASLAFYQTCLQEA